MSLFLETIRIEEGQPMHLEWHQRRVEDTLRHFYPSVFSESSPFDLAEILMSCPVPAAGTYKCRIEYGLNALAIEFLPYIPRQIKTLRLMEAPVGYDYSYKYADRKVIEDLFSQRRDADDILITRDGWITDTYVANIAFRKGDHWYTPSEPLLAGTTWKRLISNRILIPRPLHHSELKLFDSFRIFNAMNDWGGEEHGVETIW